MIEHLDRAVRPNLFDIHAEPDIAWAIILANLMSPRLWALADKVAARGEQDRCRDGIEHLHHYVDGHFSHLEPMDIADHNGVFDLAEERARLGAEAVDSALASILNEMDIRDRAHILSPRSDVRPMVDEGFFPCYYYLTIDEAHAHRRAFGHKKRKPLGVTCCLDEAALIAAVVCALERTVPDDLAIIGAPTHYTAFLAEDGGAWWFNGKREYFTRADWQQLVAAGDGAGDGAAPQREFDGRLPGFDRVFSALGNYIVPDRTSTIPEPQLRTILDELTGFFGAGLRQMQAASRLDGVRYLDQPGLPHLHDRLRIESADKILSDIRARAHKDPRSLEAAALYCFRDIRAPEPAHYLTTALRSLDTRRHEAVIANVDDAVEVVRAVTSAEPVFGSRDRLAMPDEVLHFNSGSDRDRALLLYTLLMRSPAIDGKSRQDLEIVFTDENSFVRGPDLLVETTRLERPASIGGAVQMRLALP